MKHRFTNAQLNEAARHYRGPYKPYDLVKEVVMAIIGVAALSILLAILFSSPDEKPSTIAQWSQQMPADFVTTAVAELDGSSGTAGYGPPYNHNGDGQQIWFIKLQKWLGVSHPIDTANDFVYLPLSTLPGAPAVHAAVAAYKAASAKDQTAWTTNYTNALAKATIAANGSLKVAPGTYGPVPTMMNALLALGQSGALDGDLGLQRFPQGDA